MSENPPTIRILRQPSVLAMDEMPTICPFRAFDLQYGSNPQHLEFLQWVVFCAGSRFREALIHILQRSGQRQKRWMQQALQRELNWVLRCIGRAYAIGFNIEIPLIIRCLADTLGSVEKESLPLEIDLTFAEFLASGTRDQAFDKRVKSYSHDWWNRNSVPTAMEHMGTATISEILTYHKAQFYKTFDPEPTTTFEDWFKTHISDKVPDIPPPNMALIHPVQVILNHVDNTSDACDAFHNLSIEGIQQLSSIKNHTAIMHNTADSSLDLISRRAIGLFELYEASQRAADSDKGPAPTDSNDNPASKWTWGKRLTTKEVCSLGAGKKASHSGYAESLRDGKLPERSVIKPTHSGHTSDKFESVSSVVADIHNSNEPVEYPQYFENGTDGGSISSTIEKLETIGESNTDSDVSNTDSDVRNAENAPAQAPQSVSEMLAQVEYISSDSDLEDEDDMKAEEDTGNKSAYSKANDTAPAWAAQSVSEMLAQAEYISSDSDSEDQDKDEDEDLEDEDEDLEDEDEDKDDMKAEEDEGQGIGKKRQKADESVNNGEDRRSKSRKSDSQSVNDKDSSQTTAYFTKNFFSRQLDEGLFETDADEDENPDENQDTDEDGASEGMAMQE